MSASENPEPGTGIRVATAAYVVARVLLCRPDEQLLEKFASASLRKSWPVPGADSLTALAEMDGSLNLDLAREEFDLLLGGSSPSLRLEESTLPGHRTAAHHWEELLRTADVNPDSLGMSDPDHMGAQLTWLADRTLTMVRARPGAERALADEMLTVRRQHTDPLAARTLIELREHARTQPYVALPALLSDLLDAHSELCRAVTLRVGRQ